MTDSEIHNNIITKCINLDWLSVYCIEPNGVVMDAEYYKKLGWTVECQPYGTTIYAEKFKLMNGKHVFLEIERNPYSLRQNGGIFEKGSCHIRLSNRTCYQYNAVQLLQDFIAKYKYEYKGISRIDICCDFVKFDNGMSPQKLANDYMADRVWKVHQSKIFAHTMDGDDTWRVKMELGAFGKESKQGRSWNSLKWGSPKSPISTKLYNKTLELQNNAGKYYIKDAWVKSGICDLQKVTYDYYDSKNKTHEIRSKQICVATGTAVKTEIPIEEANPIDVWRVEFSISTEGRHWVDICEGKRIDLDLCAFQSVQNRAYTFYTCAEWLFSFVRAEWYKNKNGNKIKQRTNRCHKFQLFNTKFLRHNYKPQRVTENEDATRTEKLIMNRLMKRANDPRLSDEMRKACIEVAHDINKEHQDWYLPDSENPFIRTTLKEIKIRREKEEQNKMQDSATAENWIQYQKDEYTVDQLNKNSNRWKKHNQLQIQAERKKLETYINLVRRQVEIYKKVLNKEVSLPLNIEEILETPF